MSFPAASTASARPAATERAAGPSAAVMPCTHCSLPVPDALVERGAAHQFCCAGCRGVHALLSEHGLLRYYDLRAPARSVSAEGAASTPLTPPVADLAGFEEFDDPAFEALYWRARPDGLRSVELLLEGVHCAACVWLLEKLPRFAPGLIELRVNVGRCTGQLVWDPAATSLSALARLCARVGYRPRPLVAGASEAARRREDRAQLVRLAVTGAVAGNVMLIAFALYGGALHGMEPEFARLFRWASLGLTVPAVWIGGGVFFRTAWAGLRARVLHMDLPISLGILAGFIGGLVNTVRGVGEVYFDSVTALIFLLLAGRFLQRRQQQRAAESSHRLFGLAPQSARRLEAAGAREVPAETLVAGDLIEIRAGEAVPADGRVEEGGSDLDLAILTGESRPVAVGVGDRVHAGTLNLTGRVRVRVERSGAQTRVGQLLALVEEYSTRRARIVQLADRVASVFVAVVVLLAGITLAVWWGRGAAQAIDHTLALLVVTCPCALGLATPLALVAALGAAARRGVLIKGGDALEHLAARHGVLWLDKTGTLTEGRLELRAWVGDEYSRHLAAALEAHSSHPIAAAVRRAFAGEAATDDRPGAAGSSTGDWAVEDVVQVTGGGITGRAKGQSVLLGAPSFVAARSGPLDGATEERVAEFSERGWTPVVLAVDGAVAAVGAFGDPLRAGMRDVIARLAHTGWEVGILSGDHPQVVRAVGVELGLPEARCRGGLSPEDKLAAVEASQRASAAQVDGKPGDRTGEPPGLQVRGRNRIRTGRRKSRATPPVVMVGDGVNDAVALAAADVGIGVHGGAEATLSAADVYLTRPHPEDLAALFEGARRTLRVVHRNMALSLIYNVVGATLAMVGWIHPLAAAVLMPVSSLTVVASSYKTRTFA